MDEGGDAVIVNGGGAVDHTVFNTFSCSDLLQVSIIN